MCLATLSNGMLWHVCILFYNLWQMTFSPPPSTMLHDADMIAPHRTRCLRLTPPTSRGAFLRSFDLLPAYRYSRLRGDIVHHYD